MLVLIIVYTFAIVDDFVVIVIIARIQEFITQFLAKFSIKELESAKFVVGLQILQQGGEISFSQSIYIKEIVDKRIMCPQIN